MSTGVASDTIIAGNTVYKHTDNTLKRSRGNVVGTGMCVGIALNGASTGQIVHYQRSGPINVGATLSAGKSYYVSAATAGKIAPNSDITTTNYPVYLGTATTTSNLALSIQEADVAYAGEIAGDNTDLISQTAASVAVISGDTQAGTTSSAVVAGNPVYLHTDGTYKACATTTALTAACVGIAVNSAGSGQPFDFIKTGGVIDLGATLVLGQTYVVGGSGGILAIINLGASDFVTKLGVAITTAHLAFVPHLGGLAHG